MYAVSFKKEDEDVFLRLCRDFYSSGATARGYDEEIAKKTFVQTISNHENLWGYLFLDKETKMPIGYALVTSYWCNEDGGNVIILDELYVDPAYRHHGYSSAFIEWLENEFKDKAVSVTLEVVTTNTTAKDLYQKLGFADDGFEVMTKSLKNL